MKKICKTTHIIRCERCGCTLKVFCQLKKGCYSQATLECPKCECIAGWITSSPGYALERLVCIVMEVVSGY